MPRSRVARRGGKRERTKRNIIIASASVGAVALLAIAVAVTIGITNAKSDVLTGDDIDISEEMLASSDAQGINAAQAAAASTALIEVPDTVGMQVEEAETLLAVAGFSVVRISTPAGEAATGTVLAQEPGAGSKISAGSDVRVIYADPNAVEELAAESDAAGASAAAGATGAGAGAGASGTGLVVCIDPGHQAQANLVQEPVGPGSNETKPKVTGGATGGATKQPEHALALAVSLKVKERLEAKGITVVMTRMTDAVDISNRQRAEVANNAQADLFVRIHADGSTNGDINGISTLYPGGNSWTAPIEARSLRAATLMQSSTVKATSAKDLGLVMRGDIAGFNWSKVPAVLIEMGFLSNPVEDKLMATDAYRDKLADGIADGITQYLGVQ